MSDERYRGSRAESSPDAVAADLAERFTLRLRLFALRRLRDPAAAEDTVQDALREVLKALRAGRIADPDALPGFVFQTAKNLCMHHGRSAGRRSRAILAFGRLPQGSVEDPLLALIHEERRIAVRAALARLEKDDRDVLALTFEEELDPRSAAPRPGPGTVIVRKHRARPGPNFSAAPHNERAGTPEGRGRVRVLRTGGGRYLAGRLSGRGRCLQEHLFTCDPYTGDPARAGDRAAAPAVATIGQATWRVMAAARDP